MLALLTGKLKLYGLAIGGFLLTIGYFFIRNRALAYQRDKWRQRAKGAEAQIQFETKVDEAETEIESHHSDLKRQLEQDKLKGEWPKNLRKQKP